MIPGNNSQALGLIMDIDFSVVLSYYLMRNAGGLGCIIKTNGFTSNVFLLIYMESAEKYERIFRY